MYIDVAKKYQDDPKAVDYLVKKIITGGGGVWGETAMAAHPQLSEKDATEIVKYILSLGSKTSVQSLPVKGSYTTEIPKGVSDQGVVIMRAAYTDKGANGMAPVTSEKIMVLKSSNFSAAKADKWDGVMKYKVPEPPMELMIGSGNKSYIGFSPVDLTGIEQVVLVAMAPEQLLNAAGGTVEVRIDSPTGTVIGESSPITPTKGAISNPSPIIAMAKLTPTTGMHEVYFIYKNEKSPSGQSLFILLNIQYLNGKKAANKISMR